MKRSVLTPLGKIEYDLQQTQRKSVEIRVMPGGNIRVFAPLRAPLRVSDEFVRSRAEWILQAREQFVRYEQARRAESSLESGQRIPPVSYTHLWLRARWPWSIWTASPKRAPALASGRIVW